MADELAPAWVITNQAETSDLGPDGTYVAGVKVTFRTRANVIGSVFIPHTDYTVDTVRAKVQAKADIADMIAGMQG